MKLTPQQIFDKAAVHLLVQNARAINSNGACALRGVNGTKCAVGALIDDDSAANDLDHFGMTISSMMADKEARVALVTALGASGVDLTGNYDAVPLLAHLQDAHDSTTPTQWRHRLRAIAHQHGLSGEVLA